MSVGIYPKLEWAVTGVDPLAVDGKGLAAEYFDSLESEGTESPFAPIGEMFSIDPEDAAGFAASEGVEVEPPPVRWHNAAAGVEAVKAVLKRLRAERAASRAIPDLEQIEKVLAAAQKEGVRFYLTCDMP